MDPDDLIGRIRSLVKKVNDEMGMTNPTVVELSEAIDDLDRWLVKMIPFRSDPPWNPPGREPWHRPLLVGVDGRWYFLRRFKTRAAAKTSVKRWRKHPKLPPGDWRFTIRDIDDGGVGVWFRNLDGPEAGVGLDDLEGPGLDDLEDLESESEAEE